MNERKMSKERIEEALERCEKATPGPWGCEDGVEYDARVDEYSWAVDGGEGDGILFHCGGWPPKTDDLAFVLSARTDLPDALRDLWLADAEIERLQAAYRKLVDFINKRLGEPDANDYRHMYFSKQILERMNKEAQAALGEPS